MHITIQIAVTCISIEAPAYRRYAFNFGDVVEERSERTEGFKKHLALVGEHGAFSRFRFLGDAMRNAWLDGAVGRPLGVEVLAL